MEVLKAFSDSQLDKRKWRDFALGDLALLVLPLVHYRIRRNVKVLQPLVISIKL